MITHFILNLPERPPVGEYAYAAPVAGSAA